MKLCVVLQACIISPNFYVGNNVTNQMSGEVYLVKTWQLHLLLL